jgi:hypothetical protein
MLVPFFEPEHHQHYYPKDCALEAFSRPGRAHGYFHSTHRSFALAGFSHSGWNENNHEPV